MRTIAGRTPSHIHAHTHTRWHQECAIILWQPCVNYIIYQRTGPRARAYARRYARPQHHRHLEFCRASRQTHTHEHMCTITGTHSYTHTHTHTETVPRRGLIRSGARRRLATVPHRVMPRSRNAGECAVRVCTLMYVFAVCADVACVRREDHSDI